MWIVGSLLLISGLYPLWLCFVRSVRMIRIVNILCSVLIWLLCWLGLYYVSQQSSTLHWALTQSWIHLTLDMPGMMFALMISTLWLLNLLYSFCYMSNAHPGSSHRCFFIYLSLSLASTIILAFGSDFITLLLGYELLTVSTISLVGYKRDTKSMHAMSFYSKMLLGTSLLLLLPALVYIYVHQEFNTIILIMLLLGVAKAAIFPVHSWLPKAMVAPTPVSSFLHAIAVVKSGVFLIYRLLQQLDPIAHGMDLSTYTVLQAWLLFSIIYATYNSIQQENLKLRLAFSTMQQINLMVIMLISGHYQAVEHIMYYMISHGFAKFTLFSCVGYINLLTHRTTLGGIKGLGRSMPIITIVFAIASATVIGLPFTAGFWGKEELLHQVQHLETIWPFISAICVSVGSFLNFSHILYVMVNKSSYDQVTEQAPVIEISTKASSSMKNCLYIIVFGGAMCIILATIHGFFIDLMHTDDLLEEEIDYDIQYMHAKTREEDRL